MKIGLKPTNLKIFRPLKKVLIITYYWPPASGPGVQRFLKFVKYFSSFGVHSTILTVKDGSFPATDETLLDDVPMEVVVYKTKTVEPFAIYNSLRGKKGKELEVGMANIKDTTSFFGKIARWVRSNIFIPDARVGWNSYATRKALHVIKEDNIDTIITTGPPHSSHLIGKYLKENNDTIKWIADLRDPWTSIYYEKYLNRSENSKARNQKLEDDVLKTADHVVVVSEGMKREFQDRANAISIIPNGYDGEDIPTTAPKKSEKFVLSYIGSFKANQNINVFWQALATLIAQDKTFANVFELRLTGNINQEIKDAIDAYSLSNHVAYEGYVKHSEAVVKMTNAQLLYLPIPDAENNKMILTGKIFEYMASRTPILAIGPKDGNAADTLRACERGEMYGYEDQEGIQQKILDTYHAWKTNGHLNVLEESDVYMSYERKALTRVYADLVNRM